jgi:hypothetical protein
MSTSKKLEELRDEMRRSRAEEGRESSGASCDNVFMFCSAIDRSI